MSAKGKKKTAEAPTKSERPKRVPLKKATSPVKKVEKKTAAPPRKTAAPSTKTMEEPQNAQRYFDEMMKSTVAPALRSMGFKGSGAKFYLPSDTHFSQLGIQKSSGNSAGSVRFTINISVISKEEWEESGNDGEPRPSVHYGIGWTERIGEFINGNDKWWDIQSEADANSAATEIIQVMSTSVIPAIFKQMVEK